MKLYIKFGGIKKLKENIKKAFGEKYDATELFDDILREAGQRCLAKTMERTPVDTGKLKSSWRLSDVEHRGFYNTISIENKEEYASYVEYGHRVTEKALRFLKYNHILDPSKPTKSVGGYYEPRYMATRSVEETKEELPDIAKEMIDKKLSEILP